MFGCENAEEFYYTSAVKYLLGGIVRTMARHHKVFLKFGAGILFMVLLLGVMLCFGRTSLKIHLAVRQMARKEFAPEKRNRVRPEFKVLPSDWIPAMRQPMDKIWAGLGLKGMNYFSFGGPAHWFTSYSARSDPSSPLYQAWFGVYVIAGRANWLSPDGTIVISKLAQSAEFDQNAWLKAMGDRSPQTEFVASEKEETVVIAKEVRPLITATFRSHSDLNTNIRGMSGLIGMPPDKQWARNLDSYHDVMLTGLLSTWYESADDVTIVVYANSAGYHTKDGRDVDFFPVLRTDLMSMMSGVEFKRTD